MWTVLQLLDMMLDQPLQTWSFSDESLIRVGRSLDNEVVIDNPTVSRAHVYLTRTEDRWALSALSEKGIHVDGQHTMQLDLRDGHVFRLGAHGPRLRFFVVDQSGDAQATYAGTPLGTPVFHIDEQQQTSEVEVIASSPFFQRLRAAVDKFRRDDD
jgi:serine/threonine-protein kinase